MPTSLEALSRRSPDIIITACIDPHGYRLNYAVLPDALRQTLKLIEIEA